MKTLCILIVALMLTGASGGRLTAQLGKNGTITGSAPVMLLPDPNRTPLTTLREGTPVRVLDQEDVWYQVSFKDPQLGDRVGYVRKDRVQVVEPAPVAMTASAPAPAAAPASEAVNSAATPSGPAPGPSAARTPSAATSGAEPRIARSLNGLSTESVMAALISGHQQRGKLQGLRLLDSAQGFANAMAAIGGNTPTGSSGFRLEVFTPITWIRQQASQAAKEYRQLHMEELTEDMLAPVLRITAYPDTPSMVTAAGMRGTSSVRHVVLRSEDKRLVVQPLAKEPFTEEASNAMGGKAVFEGLMLTFSLDDLRELRGPNGDREFFITVIGGTGEEKNFKVKRKHFDNLPIR